MSPAAATSVHRIWCVYNHMPGGHVVATHFGTYTLKKKLGGEGTQEIKFKAEDQMEGLKRSPYVALNINGKIEKNKVLRYGGSADLTDDPRAANVVLDWAKAQGVEPIRSVEEKKGGGEVANSRVDSLERRVSAIDTKLDQVLEAVRSNADKKS